MKELKETNKPEAKAEVVADAGNATPAAVKPSLPPGASIGKDGVLELDIQQRPKDGELSDAGLGCYFREDTGECVQGPGIHGEHEYRSVPPDQKPEQIAAQVAERRRLGFVRVAGIYQRGLAGAIVMRIPRADFERISQAKAKAAERAAVVMRREGDGDLRQSFGGGAPGVGRSGLISTMTSK